MWICGSVGVHTCKMWISMRIKIRTLPVGQKFSTASYLKNLRTLHCYSLRLRKKLLCFAYITVGTSV